MISEFQKKATTNECSITGKTATSFMVCLCPRLVAVSFLRIAWKRDGPLISCFASSSSAFQFQRTQYDGIGLYIIRTSIYTYKICWMYKKEYSCTLMHIAIWLFQSWLSYHSEISNAEEMQTMHTMFIHSWHTHKRIARHEHTIFMCNRTLSLLSLSAALSFHWTTTTLKPPLPAWSFFSSSSLLHRTI